MDKHVCTVCFRDSDCHAEKCDCGISHFPALCCPGCDCCSFEQAHVPKEHRFNAGSPYEDAYCMDCGASFPKEKLCVPRDWPGKNLPSEGYVYVPWLKQVQST